jgi:hypothetical protein
MSKMSVKMWMDLLKWLPLDENYYHPTMEGLASLFRVSWGGSRSIRNMLKLYSMIIVCV